MIKTVEETRALLSEVYDPHSPTDWVIMRSFRGGDSLIFQAKGTGDIDVVKREAEDNRTGGVYLRARPLEMRSSDCTCYYYILIVWIPPHCTSDGKKFQLALTAAAPQINVSLQFFSPRDVTVGTIVPDCRCTENSVEEFDYVDDQPVDRELECPVCISPLRDPVIYNCGGMSCRVCTKKLTACSTCNLSECQATDGVVPRYLLNFLNELKVICPTCDAHIPRSQLLLHKKQCAKECPQGCGAKIYPKSIEAHLANCQMSAVACSGQHIMCEWKGNRAARDKHEKECPYLRIKTPLESVMKQLKQLANENRDLRARFEAVDRFMGIA